MALQLPPWLDANPANIINALHAGAMIGNQRRAQDLASSEARDRLQLAYAQLASQEERASQAAQAKLDLARATMEARQQQFDLMNQYRQSQVQAAAQREADLQGYRAAQMQQREQAAADKASQFSEIQDLKQDSADALQAQRDKYNDLQDKKLKLQTEIANRPVLSDADKALLKDKTAELDRVNKQLDALGEPSSGFLGLFGGNKKQIQDLEANRAFLESDIQGFQDKMQPRLQLPGSSGTTTASTGADAGSANPPFGEGALIRHKDTGQLYRVQDGMPVPWTDQSQQTADQTASQE